MCSKAKDGSRHGALKFILQTARDIIILKCLLHHACAYHTATIKYSDKCSVIYVLRFIFSATFERLHTAAFFKNFFIPLFLFSFFNFAFFASFFSAFFKQVFKRFFYRRFLNNFLMRFLRSKKTIKKSAKTTQKVTKKRCKK